MHCIYCDKEIPDEAESCSACGKTVVTAGAAPTVDEAPKAEEAKKKPKSAANKRGAIGCIVILLLITGVCVMSQISESTRDAPRIPEDVKEAAIEAFKLSREVVDAAVLQDSDRPEKVSIATIVLVGTSVPRAGKLGDNLLRMVKSLANDESGAQTERPSKSGPGRGKYDYLVKVQDTNGNELAFGAKVSTSPRITW